jgi:cyclopropane fatty-acyl-phospholipid synthase-like methyltransferase
MSALFASSDIRRDCAYFVGSPLLRSGLRVLDAGCGTGIVTLALREALLRRGLSPGPLHGLDLTAAMIERFHRTMQKRAIKDVAVVQANVLRLDTLPGPWSNYDLIVSASMLEYLPRERLVDALAGLRERLNAAGRFVLFVTKRNWLMRPLIGRWWDANLYEAGELESAFHQAGFSTVSFRRFPLPFRHLALWGHIVEARRSP